MEHSVRAAGVKRDDTGVPFSCGMFDEVKGFNRESRSHTQSHSERISVSVLLTLTVLLVYVELADSKYVTGCQQATLR